MLTFDQKTIVVTGSSSGIGLAIAQAFLDAGGSVLGVDRSRAPHSLHSSSSFAELALDLTEPAAGDKIIAAAMERFGTCDVLVNNAGIGNAAPILDTDDGAYERYVAVNQTAVFRLCRAAVRAMQGSGGAIVNIASVFGMVGAARSAPYSATKAAVIGLTRQLATEYGRDGIRVNAIAPGLIETPLTATRLAENPWFRRMMIEGCPLGRPGSSADVASAALFLASPMAGFLTGVVLPVDGGWSMAKFLPDPDHA